LKIEPENAQLQKSLQSVSQPEDPIFGAAGRAKLMANPETAAFFQDVQFKNMFEMCSQQPQMMMQLMQSDPRFMKCLEVCTGINLA